MPGLWDQPPSLIPPLVGSTFCTEIPSETARWNRCVDTLSLSILTKASGTRNEPKVVHRAASGGTRGYPGRQAGERGIERGRVDSAALGHVRTAAAFAADLRGHVGDDLARLDLR